MQTKAELARGTQTASGAALLLLPPFESPPVVLVMFMPPIVSFLLCFAGLVDLGPAVEVMLPMSDMVPLIDEVALASELVELPLSLVLVALAASEGRLGYLLAA